MGHRRKAREYALQGIYMYDISEAGIENIIQFDWIDKFIPDDIRDFAENLIKGTIENIEEIDDLIQKYSKNWNIERLSLVDKSILRMSIFAMKYLSDIPVVVSIDEGIELGKLYGGENSGQFINGILDAFRRSELKK